MEQLLISTLLRTRVVAARGDVFNIGDRVASRYSEGWYLGTVVKGPANKLSVSYDNGDDSVYPMSEGQTKDMVILEPGTKKLARALTDAQIRVFLRKTRAVAPPAKPGKAPPATKPTVAPKPSVTTESVLRDLMDRSLDKPVTAEEYAACPFLGRLFYNGRRGPMARCVFIGFSVRPPERYGRIAVSLSPERDDVLWWPKTWHAADFERVIAKGSPAAQMRLAEFNNLRVRAHQKIMEHADNRAEREAKDRDVAKRMYDQLRNAEGKYVDIEFSNGRFAQKILSVDFRANKIGIAGSGSKLRWIPFSMLVGDIRTERY